jgi:hypothetical protein
MNELAQCHYSDNRGAENEERIETAKELLENMGAILKELNTEVRTIAEAVYRGVNPAEKAPNEPRTTPPMIAVLKEQRNMAEEVLRELVRIRGALW